LHKGDSIQLLALQERTDSILSLQPGFHGTQLFFTEERIV